MRIGVILAAYASNHRALDLALLAYRVQQELPAELIVTEDSNSPQVAEVVQRHAAAAPFPIIHLSQADDGFRKCLALNRAVAAAQADWLVFSDADVLPRADILAQYRRLAAPGRFVSTGSHLNLPERFHAQQLSEQMIRSQQLFEPAFLRSQGIALPASRLLPAGWRARVLDALSARNAFVGNHSGAWRTDVLRVGGFDEAMGYGGEDRNLGLRLNHAGVRGLRARHSLVCLHLDHPRSYRHEAEVRANASFNRALSRRTDTLPRRSLLLAHANRLTHRR